MTDGEISTSLPEIVSTPIDTPKPIPISQLREETRKRNADIETTLQYQAVLTAERAQVRVVFDALRNNQITMEEAQEILAHRSAEQIIEIDNDSLMNILSRRALEKRLTRAIALAQRVNKPLTIAFADLDDFKKINDNPNIGHDGGDAVLQAWAGHLLSGLKRAGDAIGRIGGEEVVIIMEATTEDIANTLLTKLLRSQPEVIAEAVKEIGFVLEDPVTMSVGIVQMSQEDIDNRTHPEIVMAKLIAESDVRMYKSKHEGKNRITGSTHEKETT